MPEIINGPVNLENSSEAARKRIVRAQQHGAATYCVPVAVEIRGGTYIPVEGASRPWDTAGEFRFSIFRTAQEGIVLETINRYLLAGDGRLRRLNPSLLDVLYKGERKDVEPRKVHPTKVMEEPLRFRHEWGGYVTEQGVDGRFSWSEDRPTRGVDARITLVVNPETGQEEAILSFIAVPEPGQWREIAGLGDKFTSADRPRTLNNTVDNPVPFLKPVGVIF